MSGELFKKSALPETKARRLAWRRAYNRRKYAEMPADEKAAFLARMREKRRKKLPEAERATA
jgi:hypothetical protein